MHFIVKFYFGIYNVSIVFIKLKRLFAIVNLGVIKIFLSFEFKCFSPSYGLAKFLCGDENPSVSL